MSFTVGLRFGSPQFALMYRFSIDQPFSVGVHTTSLLIKMCISCRYNTAQTIPHLDTSVLQGPASPNI